MNNKKNLPSKGVKKILTLFMIIVLIFSSVGIFYAKDLCLGYKYYKPQFTEIGITQQENFIMLTIDEYLNELEEKGYILASYELNQEILCQKSIIKRSEINEEELKTNIIDSLDVDVLFTKVKIKNDETDYYFKTDAEATNFINNLNKYKEQEYELESIINDITTLTSEEILNNKIEEVIEQKQIEDEIRAKQKQEKQIQIVSRGSSLVSSSTSPLKSYSYISSPYGMRNGKMHTGTDYAAAAGTPIYAWKSGTVTKASWNGSYGNFIEIEHYDGTVSRYAHLSGYAISYGESVYKGQTIGYVGSTGNSTGPHLHWEIKINGQFVNPEKYF